jgi:hypothetical protein
VEVVWLDATESFGIVKKGSFGGAAETDRLCSAKTCHASRLHPALSYTTNQCDDALTTRCPMDVLPLSNTKNIYSTYEVLHNTVNLCHYDTTVVQ